MEANTTELPTGPRRFALHDRRGVVSQSLAAEKVLSITSSVFTRAADVEVPKVTSEGRRRWSSIAAYFSPSWRGENASR